MKEKPTDVDSNEALLTTPLNRKRFLKLSVYGLATMTTAPFASVLAGNKRALKRDRKPNILFICTDQERCWLDLPKDLPLPAHEWLLERGTAFENYHVNTSPCGPSRSVIYTGQHTQHTGVYKNPNSPPYPQLPPSIPTIGHMLREAGYYTTYKGKWHLSNINEGKVFRGTPGGIYPNSTDVLEPYGFSDYQFDGEKVGLTWEGFMEDGVIAADAVRQLNRFAAGEIQDRPWFMAVNFVNPHDIMFFDATGRQEETRARKDWIAPKKEAPGHPVYMKDWGFDLPVSFYEDDLSSKPECHRGINELQNAFYGRIPHDDIESWRRFQNYYFNCCRDVDRHVMLLLDNLVATGLYEDTIIIYTSDHGERAGAHGMRQKGGTIYKEDLRVPLIVRHPDVKTSAGTSVLVSAIDLAPTILSFAGLDARHVSERYPDMKGVDVSAIVGGTSQKTKRDERGILFNYAVGYGWGKTDDGKPALHNRRLHRGIHDGRYKFARYFAPAQHHMPQDWETLVRFNDLELYDTKADPDELDTLANEPMRYRREIERLNSMVNALIAHEVGDDNGAEYPGDTDIYNA